MKNNLTVATAVRILADMKPLAEMLTEWRDTLKLTSAEAARRCSMSAQHYWQLENGVGVYVRPATLRKLADGTGIPLERLAAGAATAAVSRLSPVPA